MNILLFLTFMIPATLFLGAYDMMTRRVLRGGVDPSILLGIVFFVSGGVLFGLSAVIGFPELKAGFWTAFIITVALNTFAQFAWYKAFQREDASLISPLRFITPPLVFISGFFVLGEAPSLFGIIGMAMIVCGLWFLLHSEARFENTSFRAILCRPGVVFGIAGAVSFAVTFPFDKQAVLTSSPLFVAGFAFLLMGTFHTSVNILFGRFGASARKELWEIRKQLPVFVSLFTLGVLLSFHALPYTLAAYAAGVKRLVPLWVVLFSGRFLGEKNMSKKLAATFLMFAGIFIMLVYG